MGGAFELGALITINSFAISPTIVKLRLRLRLRLRLSDSGSVTQAQ